jgi:FAD/FMN-containing dehydrogenase
MSYRTCLHKALGAAVSTDPEILRAYDHDLGEMPALLLSLFRRVPNAVVLPRTVKDVCETMRIALLHHVPVTPRGQGTSGYGGSMPTRGGILMDISRMNRVLYIDAQNGFVDVEPGVVWENLAQALAPLGLDNRICPTSGLSSTVGGFFCMGGMGIGSLRYGDIKEVVTEIDVVELGGSVRTLTGADMDMYHQSAGCLGIVTRLRLLCRPRTKLHHVAIQFSNAGRIGTALREAIRLEAYSASVFSQEYMNMQAEAAGNAPGGKQGFTMLLSFEEAVWNEEAVQAMAKTLGGSLMTQSMAEHEWEQRFYPMRIKRNGPALLTGEFLIKCTEFQRAWESISRQLSKDRFGLEAFACHNGTMSVLIYILDSAEDLASLMRMGKAMLPLHAVEKFGGVVYSSGLWFSSRLDSVLGATKAQRLREYKHCRDPRGQMNPGKLCGNSGVTRACILLSHLIWVGTALSGPISRLLPCRARRLRLHKEV